MRALRLLPLALLPLRCLAWPGEVHSGITRAAIEALPREERDYIGPEGEALARIYCHFPDLNWPCYGEWGGGVGDPRAPRFPDTRREWEVSFYCLHDPVLGRGKFLPHGPPDSYEASLRYLPKAVEALREGRLEDGMRFLGVLLHYIQDSGSFPHIQPIHRRTGRLDPGKVDISGYEPKALGSTVEGAAGALSREVRELVRRTEAEIAPLLEWAGVPLERAKALCRGWTVNPEVASAVERILSERPGEFDSALLRCAEMCARVCADALHTALQFAPRPRPEPPPNPPGVNLAFNPSFEEDDGDGVPDGWCVGWLDLHDRAGRALRYRAGTHWEGHVRTGEFSALILWAPRAGIEWRQTWRRAVRVRPGERYRLSCWVEVRGGGKAVVALEFYDAAYRPIGRAGSEPAPAGGGWRRLSVEAVVPRGAKWARAILRFAGEDGAVWFDDVELVRLSGR